MTPETDHLRVRFLRAERFPAGPYSDAIAVIVEDENGVRFKGSAEIDGDQEELAFNRALQMARRAATATAAP